jgi:prepilin signal peptidase PulO-like enzyme (type II secretory pathway)
MVSALAAGGAMLMTLGFSGIARSGLPRGTNAGAIPAIAATICGAVLSSFALAGRDLTWPEAALISCTSVCAATDLKLGFIYDRVLLASLTAIVATTWNLGRLTDGALAAIVCAGAILIPFALSRGRGMGFGDVKFAGTTALALGLHASLHALLVACVSGGSVAALALATGRAHPRSRMPFGAFIAFGSCAALIAGDPR